MLYKQALHMVFWVFFFFCYLYIHKTFIFNILFIYLIFFLLFICFVCDVFVVYNARYIIIITQITVWYNFSLLQLQQNNNNKTHVGCFVFIVWYQVEVFIHVWARNIISSKIVLFCFKSNVCMSRKTYNFN